MLVAAMATWGLEDADAILAAAVAEVDWIGRPDFDDVRRAADGAWTPPPGASSLDAAQTVAAVTHVIRGSTDAAAAMTSAVRSAATPTRWPPSSAASSAEALGQPRPALVGQVSFPTTVRWMSLAARLAALRRGLVPQ